MPNGTNYAQIIKFAVAGAIGAGVEIGTYIYLVDFVEMYYLTANVLAITLAIFVNYIISQRWVFDGGRYNRGTEFTVFVLVSIVALFLNQLLMWILVENSELEDKICKILAIATVAFFNYFAKKFFVFKG